MTVTLIAALLVGCGAAVVVTTLLQRVRTRTDDLREILDLPFGEADVPIEAITETRSPIVAGAVDVAAKLVDHYDTGGRLAAVLERARIPLRPGEYVFVTSLAAGVLAFLLAAVTQAWLLGIAAAVAVVVAAARVPGVRIRRRSRAIADQLPDALSLIASSLSAGHTFLRAIQLMVEESEPPLSEEFALVVHETRLGDPLVDALDRMARRTGVRDLVWVMQAIRIQQASGGKLADLLHSLADFIRGREEVRREVQVLTAEGRMSAWVLSALPVLLLVAIQVTTPTYLAPMFSGWGLAVLAATAASMVTGTVILFRMVKIEV